MPKTHPRRFAPHICFLLGLFVASSAMAAPAAPELPATSKETVLHDWFLMRRIVHLLTIVSTTDDPYVLQQASTFKLSCTAGYLSKEVALFAEQAALDSMAAAKRRLEGKAATLDVTIAVARKFVLTCGHKPEPVEYDRIKTNFARIEKRLGVAKPRESRTWKDDTGAFSLVASYVRHTKETVTLLKDDGSWVDVPITRLSDEDRQYLINLIRSGK